MATQMIAARTAEQYLENEGWPRAALAVERARQNAAGFFARVGKTLQTVSVDLQPFRHSTHVWPTEQASINSILMG